MGGTYFINNVMLMAIIESFNLFILEHEIAYRSRLGKLQALAKMVEQAVMTD
jgi:hypothetical protein